MFSHKEEFNKGWKLWHWSEREGTVMTGAEAPSEPQALGNHPELWR